MIVGALAYVAGNAADQFGSAFNAMQPSGDGGDAGIAIAIGGLAVMGAGMALAFSARTTVKSSTGSVFTESPAPPRKRPLFALTARGLEF